MIEIDARNWDADVRRELERASVRGVATIQVSDNLRVVVLDENMWKVIADSMPTAIDVLKASQSGDKTD